MVMNFFFQNYCLRLIQ